MASFVKTVLGWVPHLLLAGALLLYVPWILGIPGTSTADYADGWYIGYAAINAFIPVYAILGVVGVISRFGWLPIPFGWIRIALWCSAGAFAVAMTIAIYAILN
ncbi:hypothetical protein [Devosia naphthalenivorans]|uniref:hypothetical protein n=1 Tax=Devosia naphthalenivorans TaxID=2082392 RepID=UPI000D35A9DF|nr:hypothetical protein [Devosia naphthalenivorans]